MRESGHYWLIDRQNPKYKAVSFWDSESATWLHCGFEDEESEEVVARHFIIIENRIEEPKSFEEVELSQKNIPESYKKITHC